MSVQYDQIQQRNEELLDSWSNPGIEKRGESAVTGFVRTRVREDSVLDRLIEPVQVPAGGLTKRVHDDNPYMVLEKEPFSPGAMSVPLGTSPLGFYIMGNRYEMHFNRIMTRKFFKDVAQLHSYDMDIRQIVSDNSIRDMGAEKDSKFITAVELALGGAAGTPLQWHQSAPVQWKAISGGVGRESLNDALAIMPSATPYASNIEATRIVVNSVFVYQVMKMGFDEAGDEQAGEWMKNGWSSGRYLNRDWIVSIKRDIFPDNRMYLFGDNAFLGKHFYIEETTMSVKREYFILSWFAYALYGCTIANLGAIAIADFV